MASRLVIAAAIVVVAATAGLSQAQPLVQEERVETTLEHLHKRFGAEVPKEKLAHKFCEDYAAWHLPDAKLMKCEGAPVSPFASHQLGQGNGQHRYRIYMQFALPVAQKE